MGKNVTTLVVRQNLDKQINPYHMFDMIVQYSIHLVPSGETILQLHTSISQFSSPFILGTHRIILVNVHRTCFATQ
jgi:hypothetical protein